MDLNGNGYRLSGPRDGVLFDLNGLGNVRWVGWTTGDDDAWLAYDRNGNGMIDNGTELFGNAVRLTSGRVAQHGYEALGEFDSDGDGKVSGADANFSALLVWTDANRNGQSESAELRSLAATGIQALDLETRSSGRRDRSGNQFRLRAKMYMANGAQRFSYDVWWENEAPQGIALSSFGRCNVKPAPVTTKAIAAQ